MEPFQVKKRSFAQKNYFGTSRQVFDNLITFGNLDVLKRDDFVGYHQRYHRFHPGNYIFTKLSNEESNTTLVIHLENVDPEAILKILHEETKINKAAIAGGKQYRDGTSKIGNDVNERCDICGDETGVSFDHPMTASIVDYYLMHKIYDARIQHGDNPNEAKSKAAKYLDLWFVVNDLHWMDTTEWKLTQIDEGYTYQLEFQDGVKIGYAFDVKQYFGDKTVRVVLLQYPNWQYLNDSSAVGTTPFALVLEYEDANLIRPEFFVHPMSEFFYESEYRRFIENDQKQVNPYFGAQDDRSVFSDLPPNLFVKILSYLTLKERILVRRVNTHWRKISNDVLAIGTKRIDLICDHMIKDWTNADLNHLLPLMTGGLESLIISRTPPVELIRYTRQFDFEFIRPDVSFRSLLEVDIGHFTLDYKLAKILMEKAPNLKTFNGNMELHVREESAGDQRSFKSVEDLVLGRDNYGGAINIGDSYLMALVDLFPNVRRLSLHNLNFISASAASVMAERLGPKLEELEMRFATNPTDKWYRSVEVRSTIPPLGVFDGIGSCVNLKTLILVDSHYISIGFTEALADGCPELETLDLSNSLLPNGSSAPLEKLAALTKLTKLNVNYIEGVSNGLVPVVRQGHLEQLLLRDSYPSPELIKACIRYCAGLFLLDMRSDKCTMADAIESLTSYGRYGSTRRTVIRATGNHVWCSAQVRALQLAIKDGGHPHSGLFVIDMRRCSPPFGFIENAAEEYEKADPNVLLLEDDDDDYDPYEHQNC